jgi:hypothetical protein
VRIREVPRGVPWRVVQEKADGTTKTVAAASEYRPTIAKLMIEKWGLLTVQAYVNGEWVKVSK